MSDAKDSTASVLLAGAKVNMGVTTKYRPMVMAFVPLARVTPVAASVKSTKDFHLAELRA
ncbi:MAG: hypothetical protein IJR09_03275 [Paludibacteraceae bacterium]|nr:hypothetical protein [Paludibacteraceae bacterium]